MLSVGLLFNQFVTQTRGVFKLENCLECLRQREPACNALVFQNIFFPFPALGTCLCSFTQSYLWRPWHVNHTYWCPRMSRIYSAGIKGVCNHCGACMADECGCFSLTFRQALFIRTLIIYYLETRRGGRKSKAYRVRIIKLHLIQKMFMKAFTPYNE